MAEEHEPQERSPCEEGTNPEDCPVIRDYMARAMNNDHPNRRWNDGKKWWYGVTAIISIITLIVSTASALVTNYVGTQLRDQEITAQFDAVTGSIARLKEEHIRDMNASVGKLTADIDRLSNYVQAKLEDGLTTKVSHIAEDVAEIKGYLNLLRHEGFQPGHLPDTGP